MIGTNSTLTRPGFGNRIAVPFKPANGFQSRNENLHRVEEDAASAWFSELRAVVGLAIIVGYIAWSVALRAG